MESMPPFYVLNALPNKNILVNIFLGHLLLASSQSVSNNIWITQSWHCGHLGSTCCPLQYVQCFMRTTENFLRFVHIYAIFC